MVKYNEIIPLIEGCFDKNITPLIWGAHGIGKSQIIKQFAKDNNYKLVELRLGQLEPMDLVGLPEKKNEKTFWLKPQWFPENGKGILFLDEINRGHPDIMQAIFQLVLDKELHTHKLPDNWKVICAANYADSEYNVTDMDPALMNRFFHINMEFDNNSWNDWAEKSKINSKIIEFVNKDNLKRIEIKKLNLTTTPRSLEMLDNLISSKYINEDLYYNVCKGLLDNQDVSKMLKLITNKQNIEILNGFDEKEIKEMVEKKQLTTIHETNDVLVRELKNIDKLSDKEITNLGRYLNIIPTDISKSFMHKIKNNLLFDSMMGNKEFIDFRIKIAKELQKDVKI